MVAALTLAGLTLTVHATALSGALSQLIGACVLRLRATYATPGGMAGAGAGLVLTAAVAVRTALTAASHLRLTRRQALRHARTARRPDSYWGRWSWRWPPPCSRSPWAGFLTPSHQSFPRSAM